MKDNMTEFIKEYYGDKLLAPIQVKSLSMKNSLNAKYMPVHHEVNTMPSLTVPDETMSVREIMTRYAKGLPIGGKIAGEWVGDEDIDNFMPDPRKMDMVERQAYKEEAQEELRNYTEKYKKKSKKDDTQKNDVETNGNTV